MQKPDPMRMIYLRMWKTTSVPNDALQTQNEKQWPEDSDKKPGEDRFEEKFFLEDTYCLTHMTISQTEPGSYQLFED